MRGMELPINVLVVVAIAIIVLLGVIILYFIGWSPFSTAITLESIKNKYCAMVIQHGCPSDVRWFTISDFDANRNGKTGWANGETTASFDWTNLPVACTLGVSNIDPNVYGDNLASLCYCYYFRQSDVACRQLCGCP